MGSFCLGLCILFMNEISFRKKKCPHSWRKCHQFVPLRCHYICIYCLLLFPNISGSIYFMEIGRSKLDVRRPSVQIPFSMMASPLSSKNNIHILLVVTFWINETSTEFVLDVFLAQLPKVHPEFQILSLDQLGRGSFYTVHWFLFIILITGANMKQTTEHWVHLLSCWLTNSLSTNSDQMWVNATSLISYIPIHVEAYVS